ncbi:MAG: hypothetical protein ACFFHD_07370 [Promethearchaeota archaeon]
MNRVLNKIRQDKKEFITSDELKKYCEELYCNYFRISDYLISRGFLLSILDDIYYVKTANEINQNKLKYSFFKLLSKALEFKRINNWYFGLYTALDLLDIEYDHQENNYFYLINDKILNNQPTNILGKTFRFLRFKNSLFDFGIVNDKTRYSDQEKTILDLIYLWEYNHMNDNRIIIEVSKILDGISEEKILEYSQYYPESNRKLLKKALNRLPISAH